jgi:hypothetical protein
MVRMMEEYWERSDFDAGGKVGAIALPHHIERKEASMPLWYNAASAVYSTSEHEPSSSSHETMCLGLV